MTENRVVQGRMVTPRRLAEMIEDGEVMDAEEIADADFECPDCGGSVLSVGYMPAVTEYVTGYKCQDCDWKDTDRSD